MTLVAERLEEPQLLQCMEIWGGNQATAKSVSLSGLDAWVVSRPHQGGSGGGDIHYVSSCATGRINRLLLADVSGHGEKVAAIALKLRDLMRRFVNRLDQGAFVQSLNRDFASIGRVGRFATAVATTYWSPTGTLEICNAGHPRPLWYRARHRRWELLEQETRPADDRTAGHPPRREVVNVPLGVVDLTRYEARRVRLEPGDRVLLYTDALTEAQSPEGALLDEEGLLACVRGLPALAPAALIHALLEAVARHRGGAPADDDETVMLFQPNGRAPRMTVAERVRSAWLLLREMMHSLKPGGPPMPLPDVGVKNTLGFFLPRLDRGIRRGAASSSAP